MSTPRNSEYDVGRLSIQVCPVTQSAGRERDVSNDRYVVGLRSKHRAVNGRLIAQGGYLRRKGYELT
jgi:hypothetical protein